MNLMRIWETLNKPLSIGRKGGIALLAAAALSAGGANAADNRLKKITGENERIKRVMEYYSQEPVIVPTVEKAVDINRDIHISMYDPSVGFYSDDIEQPFTAEDVRSKNYAFFFQMTPPGIDENEVPYEPEIGWGVESKFVGELIVEDENYNGAIDIGETARAHVGVPQYPNNTMNLGEFKIDRAWLAYIYPGNAFEKGWLESTPLIKKKGFWRRNIALYKEILKDMPELLENFVLKEQDALFSGKLDMAIAQESNKIVFKKRQSTDMPEGHNYYQMKYLFNVLVALPEENIGRAVQAFEGPMEDALTDYLVRNGFGTDINMRGNVRSDNISGFSFAGYKPKGYDEQVFIYLGYGFSQADAERARDYRRNPILSFVSNLTYDNGVSQEIYMRINWLDGLGLVVDRSIWSYCDSGRLVDMVKRYLREGSIHGPPQMLNYVMEAKPGETVYMKEDVHTLKGKDIYFYCKDKVYAMNESALVPRIIAPDEPGEHVFKARAVDMYGVSSELQDFRLTVAGPKTKVIERTIER